MRSVDFQEDTDKGTTSVTFTISSHDARELSELAVLLQAARSMTREQAWLGVEIEAQLAYFGVLEKAAKGPTIGFRTPDGTAPVQDVAQPEEKK